MGRPLPEGPASEHAGFRSGHPGKRPTMELSQQIPSGAVAAADLTDLVEAPGPFLTARLALSPAEIDADRRGRLAWEALAAHAQEAGAPTEVTDAVGALVEEIATTEPGVVVVANADGIVAVEVTEPTWTQDEVRWQPLPWFAPVVSARQSRVEHAVVRVDRTGAELEIIGGGEVREERQIQGRTIHIRKVGAGGWSQRRFQERAEEGWRANADEVTDEVVSILRDGDADVVLVGGELRSTALVDDRIPDELADRVVPVEITRAADGAEELEDEAIRRALADVVARQSVDLLRELKEAVGQERAETKAHRVLATLGRSQVAVLLASDGDGTTMDRIDGEAEAVVEQLEAATGAPRSELPLVDGACWAAVSSGAAVRTVAASPLEDEVAALLRWQQA
jgi:hypothetical protein